MKKVHFATLHGEEVFFDGNGDPAAKYELLNWQDGKEGKTNFVTVGIYDASLPPHHQLSLNNFTIVWGKDPEQV